MDFDFSDDQEQLRDAVRKWVDKGYDFERRRKTVARPAASTASAYNELAELGLRGPLHPRRRWRHGHGPGRRHGGHGRAGTRHRAGASDPDADRRWRAVRLCAVTPSRRSGCRKSPRARRWWYWLTRSARHATSSTFAKPKRPSPAPDGHLTATKNMVPAGDQADAFIVPATVDGKIALFLVERSASRCRPRAATARRTARAPPICSSRTRRPA